MLEPARARNVVGIETAAPVPVVPAGAADMRHDRTGSALPDCARRPVRKLAQLTFVIESRDVHETRTGGVLLALLCATLFPACARSRTCIDIAVGAGALIARHSRPT